MIGYPSLATVTNQSQRTFPRDCSYYCTVQCGTVRYITQLYTTVMVTVVAARRACRCEVSSAS